MPSNPGTVDRFAFDATAESSYGTVAAVPDKSWPGRFQKPRLVIGALTDEDSLTGNYEEGLESIPGKKHMEWDGDFDLRLDGLGAWAKFLIAAPVTTGVGPYTHTYNLSQADNSSLTAYYRDAKTTSGSALRYPGCKVESLRLSGRAGDKMLLSPKLLGQGVETEQASVSMPALNTDTIQPFSNISAFTIGGVDYKARLQELDITLENVYDLQGEFGAGALTLPALTRIGFKASGRMRFIHDENPVAGLLDDVELQTNRAVVLTLTSGVNSFTLNLYKCYFDDHSTDGIRALKRKPVTFKALYSGSDSKTLQLVVVNGTSVYT